MLCHPAMQHIRVHAVLHRKRSQRDVGLQTLRHHLGLELRCVAASALWVKSLFAHHRVRLFIVDTIFSYLVRQTQYGFTGRIRIKRSYHPAKIKGRNCGPFFIHVIEHFAVIPQPSISGIRIISTLLGATPSFIGRGKGRDFFIGSDLSEIDTRISGE